MGSGTAIVAATVIAGLPSTQDHSSTLHNVHWMEERTTSPPTNTATDSNDILAQPENAGPIPNDETISAPAEELDASAECVVCGSDQDEAAIPDVPATNTCGHEPEICLDCLQRIIETSILSGTFLSGIPCPTLGCGQIMTYFDVQRWAGPEMFERYDTLLFQNSLRSDLTWVWCVSPSCEAGQEHTGGEASNIVTCHACGSKMCFRHQSQWHEGLSCPQWDEQLAIEEHGERWTDEWILTETKACPNCKARILKNEGCDHMTCKKPGGCGHQFCWECLAPWNAIVRGDNSRHYDNCTYYTGVPGGHPAPQNLVTGVTTQRQRSVRVPGREAGITFRPLSGRVFPRAGRLGENMAFRTPIPLGEYNAAELYRPRPPFARDVDPPVTRYRQRTAWVPEVAANPVRGPRREIFTRLEMPPPVTRVDEQQEAESSDPWISPRPRYPRRAPGVSFELPLNVEDDDAPRRGSSRDTQNRWPRGVDISPRDSRQSPSTGRGDINVRAQETVVPFRYDRGRVSLDEPSTSRGETRSTSPRFNAPGRNQHDGTSRFRQAVAAAVDNLVLPRRDAETTSHQLAHQRQRSAPNSPYGLLGHPPAIPGDRARRPTRWGEALTAVESSDQPTVLAASTEQQNTAPASDSQREANSTHFAMRSWLRKQIHPIFGTRQPSEESAITSANLPSTSAHQTNDGPNPPIQPNRLHVIPTRRSNAPEIHSYF